MNMKLRFGIILLALLGMTLGAWGFASAREAIIERRITIQFDDESGRGNG